VLGEYHFFQQIVIIGYLGGLAIENDYGIYFLCLKNLYSNSWKEPLTSCIQPCLRTYGL
jgi:hypothetical protein